MRKILFLDRDGTINYEINYLYHIEDFRFIPGTIEALKFFKQKGYLLVIITNQAGIAKGLYKEKDTINLHNFMLNLFEINGVKIDYITYCPHHINGIVKKYSIDCDCRKPKIGMVNEAINYFKRKNIEVSLEDSIIVGDKEIDIETGLHAKIGKKVLVRSGHLVDEKITKADLVFNSLFDFYLYMEGKDES